MAGEISAPFVDDKKASAISLISRACLEKFERLHDILQSLPSEEAGDIELDVHNAKLVIEDALARFKAWGTNIAAFRDGNLRISLDFRLREAPRVKGRALRILRDLEEYLDDVTSISTGDKPNTSWSLDDLSDSSDEFEEDASQEKEEKIDETNNGGYGTTSELDELLKAISASNSSLMKLSIVIRSSATRDDYVKAASRFQTWNAWPDISHVIEKYGKAKHSEKWLLERLGKTISRRRQFLKYRVEHHQKMTGLDDDEEERVKPEKTIFASTKATTFLGYENIIQNIKTAGSDAGNSFGTQTSYDATVFGNVSEPAMLRIPSTPKFAFPDVKFEYGKVFLCPYCFTEQTVDNRAAWKKHVFRDLKPYVCTFDGCEMLMFRSRNEWFAHELQYHRREWVCQFCDHIPFMSVLEFSKHIKASHTTVLATSPLQALILQSEEQVDKIASDACLLCDDWESDLKRKHSNRNTALVPLKLAADKIYGTSKAFRKHLGRHMEQLALFALPRNQDDEELEDKSSDEYLHNRDNSQVPDGEADFDNGSDARSETAGAIHSDVLEDDKIELNLSSPPPALDQEERQSIRKSSYWSVPDQTSFPKLLSQYGTDWHAIAKHMTTKTHIMVKNYYLRNVEMNPKAAEWKAIAQAADERKSRGERNDHMSKEPATSKRKGAHDVLKLDTPAEELNSVGSNNVDNEEPKKVQGDSRPASLSAHDNEPKISDNLSEEYYGIDDELDVRIRGRGNPGQRYPNSGKQPDYSGGDDDELEVDTPTEAEREKPIEIMKERQASQLAEGEKEEDEREKEYKLRLDEDQNVIFVPQSVPRSRRSWSLSRPTSFSSQDSELEKTRRELEYYKIKDEEEKQEQEAIREAGRKEAIEKFKAEKIKRPETYEYSWSWTCHFCHPQGPPEHLSAASGMLTNNVKKCVECDHLRCNTCILTQHKHKVL